MAEALEQVQGATTQVDAAPEGLNIDDTVADIAESLALVPAAEEKEPKEVVDAAKSEDAALAEEAKKEVVNPKAAEAVGDTPPDTWRKEAKEQWATVPPLLKEEIRKRESDISKYVEESKAPRAVAEQLQKIVEPYLPMFQKHGVNAWDNMAAMFKAQELLLFGSPETKLQMLHNIAQQAGIKIEGGTFKPADDAQSQYTRSLEQRLEKLEGGVRNVTSTLQEARIGELTDAIQVFANDKEAHPYFEEVAGGIKHFIDTGAAKSLEEAYNLAVMANPITKQRFLETETARVVKSNAAAEAERAAKARKTGAVRVRTTGRAKVEQPLGDIDSTLKDTLADINSRH